MAVSLNTNALDSNFIPTTPANTSFALRTDAVLSRLAADPHALMIQNAFELNGKTYSVKVEDPAIDLTSLIGGIGTQTHLIQMVQAVWKQAAQHLEASVPGNIALSHDRVRCQTTLSHGGVTQDGSTLLANEAEFIIDAAEDESFTRSTAPFTIHSVMEYTANYVFKPHHVSVDHRASGAVNHRAPGALVQSSTTTSSLSSPVSYSETTSPIRWPATPCSLSRCSSIGKGATIIPLPSFSPEKSSVASHFIPLPEPVSPSDSDCSDGDTEVDTWLEFPEPLTPARKIHSFSAEEGAIEEASAAERLAARQTKISRLLKAMANQLAAAGPLKEENVPSFEAAVLKLVAAETATKTDLKS